MLETLGSLAAGEAAVFKMIGGTTLGMDVRVSAAVQWAGRPQHRGEGRILFCAP